jgi:hypothetical protein
VLTVDPSIMAPEVVLGRAGAAPRPRVPVTTSDDVRVAFGA